jgi:probable phosphoglycerate mutase
MATIVLLRHGETDWNANRRLQGWAPTPLNEYGREQAANAGEHLASRYEFDRVVASDRRRTRETAELVCEALGPDPTFESAWRERDFGIYQGLSYDTMFEEYPEFDVGQSGRSALDATPEAGESLLDLRERVLDGFERLLNDATDEAVLIVTHGGPLYAVLSHVKNIDYATAINEGSQNNCAVNELRYESDGFEVVRENDTSYRE